MSNITAIARFPSVELTWQPPEEPNGHIIAYGVTYSVNGSELFIANSTDANTHFIIPDLTPGAINHLSALSVSAYTSIGQGNSTYYNMSNITTTSDNTGMLLTLRHSLEMNFCSVSHYSVSSDCHLRHHIMGPARVQSPSRQLYSITITFH